MTKDEIRERMMALVNEAFDECIHTRCMDCEYNIGNVENPSDRSCQDRLFADLLIKNGVTFATDTNVDGKWISVSKRLPERAGMAVLVVAENTFGQKHVVKAFTDYTGRNGFLTNEKEYDLIWDTAWKITHWMPLPTPPKEDNNHERL